jgi:hypothetical protein
MIEMRNEMLLSVLDRTEKGAFHYNLEIPMDA